jgi:hypothetical protein
MLVAKICVCCVGERNKSECNYMYVILKIIFLVVGVVWLTAVTWGFTVNSCNIVISGINWQEPM